MLIHLRSGEFWHSWVYKISKGHAQFTKKLGMTFANFVDPGVPEFAGTEMNQHSGDTLASQKEKNLHKKA